MYGDTQRPQFSVALLRGLYRVIDPAGQIVGGAHDKRRAALTQRDVLQAEADRKAKRMTRDCLCCGNPFESAGIHNRLCNRCRGLGDQAGLAIPAHNSARIRRAAQT